MSLAILFVCFVLFMIGATYYGRWQDKKNATRFRLCGQKSSPLFSADLKMRNFLL